MERYPLTRPTRSGVERGGDISPSIFSSTLGSPRNPPMSAVDLWSGYSTADGRRNTPKREGGGETGKGDIREELLKAAELGRPWGWGAMWG